MYYVDKLSLDYAWTSGHARTGRARAWKGGGPKINGWVLVLLQNLFRAELILRGSIFNVTGLYTQDAHQSVLVSTVLRRLLERLWKTTRPSLEVSVSTRSVAPAVAEI